MTDQEIVKALIERDPHVTDQYFFKDCRRLMLSVIYRVFDKQKVDYDEIINELYIHLMENDAKRLRQFQFNSTLYQWLKTTAIRLCLKIKMGIIDNGGGEPPINKEPHTEEASTAKMDLDNLIKQMKNQRYATVIRLLIIEDQPPADVAKQLQITTDNLYNIKRRAMAALIETAKKDKEYYER